MSGTKTTVSLQKSTVAATINSLLDDLLLIHASTNLADFCYQANLHTLFRIAAATADQPAVTTRGA